MAILDRFAISALQGGKAHGAAPVSPQNHLHRLVAETTKPVVEHHLMRWCHCLTHPPTPVSNFVEPSSTAKQQRQRHRQADEDDCAARKAPAHAPRQASAAITASYRTDGHHQRRWPVHWPIQYEVKRGDH